ncbi:MAG: bifunctional non-ous end joining protein LigD [Thermoleophilaceae bacterium]|jgi:bifunctional non-homologous end joining protein LigD|nr:bifunctional non-ous end joining protein LigD [Thermoleophilaceae bacterium]
MVTPTKNQRKKTEPLKEYRRKRDFSATSEPGPDGGQSATGNRFVVQEHSATRLHWDLRLERDGVAVSWAVPNGIPEVPGENRMAVHTEDHPLEYLTWEGVIPKGSYGAGTMKVWDAGTYETHEWTDEKATVTFRGERVVGRYHLFHIGGREGNDWMIRRVDPPVDPDREPMPEHVVPITAVPGPLPRDDSKHAYEIQWRGLRALALCEPGRLRLDDAGGGNITTFFPELSRLVRSVGAHSAIFDGELVALGDDGKPDPERLARRAKPGSDSAMRRRARDIPVVYEIYDLIYVDGHPLIELPWAERRRRLHELELEGEHWRVSQHHEGDGAALIEAARANGLPGIVAKPLASPYAPGAGWIAISIDADQAEPSSQVANYYRTVAPVLLPHLTGRAEIDSEPALIAFVDAGNVELRVPLALRGDSERPTQMVFGIPAGDAAEAALLLRGMFDELGMKSFAKTTGDGGLDVHVPLNSDVTYEQTGSFARQVAQLVAKRWQGAGRIDPHGNDPSAVTLAPYSLRQLDRPRVATPVTWDEVVAGELDYDYAAVVKRLDKHGDLFAPLLSLVQTLPG